MRVLGGTDILHLDAVAALGAALERALAARDEPVCHMAVRWHAGAADVLLVAEGADGDRVVERACAVSVSRICRCGRC